jgi:hypothetical protein
MRWRAQSSRKELNQPTWVELRLKYWTKSLRFLGNAPDRGGDIMNLAELPGHDRWQVGQR